jgi:penicillin-binding protein 1C
VFELLPRDKRPPPAPPAGAILVDNADQLPKGLRVFSRAAAQSSRIAGNIPPPTISFPPDGATVPLPQSHAADIPLKAAGGREPLTWLVNGRLLGSFDRFQPVAARADGEGVTRITVIDASGRSDTSQVRFKHMP